jgi:methylamine---glutamate N-methyltransferase subunit B
VGGVSREAVSIRATDFTTREINEQIRKAIADGTTEIELDDPAGRHNLAVALDGEGVTITCNGTVGYFLGALGMGPDIEVNGNAGWSAGADLMRGSVTVHGNAGSSIAAACRGGTVVIDGDVGARCGIALKGGTVVIGGNVGYMSAFMMQTGTLVVGGDAADGLGDSMYAGDIFVGGKVEALGADAVMRDPTDEELVALKELLTRVGHDPDREWKHVTSGGRLHHFQKEQYELWREAL